MPEYSNWQCHLFGANPGEGLCYRPLKGNEPNRFWRWMQFICFGNRWVLHPGQIRTGAQQ